MDERIWTDGPLNGAQTLRIGDSKVSLVAPPAQACLVTGDLSQRLKLLSPKSQLVGLCEKVNGEHPYAIRIARDSALLVLQVPLVRPMGWQPEGFALSDASDAYAALSITGAASGDILAQGTGAPLEAGSPSAAIRFAGIPTLLVGFGEGHLLWVQSASLTYITSFIKGLTV
ncbi:hypothetical protein [Lentibacter sp. XHP0401]|uniref:hypothetical protein n=1 Tax=Lentibacter sp. XHP0401 TaxID=2984334 RepID=UPI0021E8D9FA|nr:hypothetical protein [Lentibacter sp. XHP0401]MCV2894683.1 hypothetical protein [Lentibacter sp. XHP0401]